MRGRRMLPMTPYRPAGAQHRQKAVAEERAVGTMLTAPLAHPSIASAKVTHTPQRHGYRMTIRPGPPPPENNQSP